MSRVQAIKIIMVICAATTIALVAFPVISANFSVGTIIIAFCLVVFAVVLMTQIFWVRKMNSTEISNIGDFGSGVASTLTAVTLVGAGLVYYYDTQWDPKVSVDIAANAYLLQMSPNRSQFRRC